MCSGRPLGRPAVVEVRLEGSVKGVEAEMAVRIHNEVTLHIGADLRALGERLGEK
jgi:hypothetical protein